MAGKSEMLAMKFEAKVRDAEALLQTLGDEDWKKVTAAEKWPVGVTAHHLASAFDPVARIVSGIVSGQLPGGFTSGMLDEMNARHAREHAGCTRPETIALLKAGATRATAVVRGLSDEQLATRATVFTDAPPMTAEQMIVGALIDHVDEHIGSIRKTVGK